MAWSSRLRRRALHHLLQEEGPESIGLQAGKGLPGLRGREAPPPFLAGLGKCKKVPLLGPLLSGFLQITLSAPESLESKLLLSRTLPCSFLLPVFTGQTFGRYCRSIPAFDVFQRRETKTMVRAKAWKILSGKPVGVRADFTDLKFPRAVPRYLSRSTFRRIHDRNLLIFPILLIMHIQHPNGPDQRP